MALSDYEKQVLEQMEEEFRRADPAFASQMESPIEDHAPLRLSPRRIAAGALLAVVGLIVLVAAVSLGYSLVSILLGVAGFILMVGGVWFAISSPKGSGVPSLKKKVKRQRSSWASFLADQERRWQERGRH
ncbi:DUF3040 domain-containing protein [Schaalia cardiffensis]|uniref:DUF3040 domain-containing protein n=1 Tax=Schaalia cardiffensis TaxID=181487 RepID=UPI0018E89CA1|nr:DUF3040 domain-containing protein [Schaalia cardiffensis]